VLLGGLNKNASNTMNKITTIIGLSFAIFFLVGLATTLTRSMMIYEAFIDKS